MGKRENILALVVSALLLRTTSAQTCPCGYGGLCTRDLKEWIIEPCRCGMFNEKDFSPRYQIKSDGTCNQLAKHCDEAACGKNEKCEESLGMGLCRCSFPSGARYLTNCSVPSKNYMSGILIYYPTIQHSWTSSFYFVYSRSPTFSGSHQIVARVEKWRKIRRIVSNPKEEHTNCPPVTSCRNFAAANSKYYDAKLCELYFMHAPGGVNCIKFDLKFPLEVEHPNVIKAVSSYPYKALGRLEPLSVQVSLDGVKYFDKEFTIFFDYNPEIIRCSRALKAHGCSSDYAAPTIYERQASIVLSSSFVPHFKCGTMTSEPPIWSLLGAYANEKWSSDFTSQGDKKLFPPRIFDQGLHVVEVEGILKGSTTNYGGSGTYYQHTFCFFEVVKGEMKFDIDGGHRTAGCNAKLIVKGVNQNENYDLKDVDITWSCFNSDDAKDCGITKKGIGPHDWTLPCSKKYVFLLRATDKLTGKKVSAMAEIRLNFGSSSLEIRCTTCDNAYKINPDIHLSLTATETPSYNEIVQWSAVDETKQTLNLEATREPTARNVLKLHSNSLKSGKTYNFTAKTTRGSAIMTIVMNEPPVGGTCNVTPTQGIRGLTRFNVSCHGWMDVDEPLKYTLLDIYTDHTDVITRSSYGDIHGVPFFSENIQVRIMDRLELEESFNLTLQLESLEDPVVLKERLQYIDKLFQYKDYEKFLDETASAALLLEPKGHPKGFKLNLMKKIDAFDAYDEFLYAERVVQIVYNLFKKTDPYEEDADRVLLGGSETIANFIKKARDLIKIEDLKKGTDNLSAYIVRDFVNMANSVCFYQYPEFNYTESDLSLQQLHKRRHKRSMENVVKGLDELVNIVSQVSQPGDEEPYEIIRGGLTLWSKTDSVAKLGPFLVALLKKGKPTLQFSEEAAELYSNETMSVNLLVLGNDVFSWAETNTSSLIAQFTLKKLENNSLVDLEEAKGPFYITIPMITDIGSVEINGTAIAPRANAGDAEKDRSVSVHHILVPAGSGMVEISVNRTFFGKIKMEVKYLKRPSFESLSLLPTLNQEKIRRSFFNNDTRLQSDFYVGIIPAQNSPIQYSFNVTVFRCLIWSQDDWRSDVCYFVGQGMAGGGPVINCSCSHLSFFSAQTFLPPNTLALNEDIYLFASILQNVYVAVLVAVILLFYFILLLWGSTRDRQEKKNVNLCPPFLTSAMYLEDNYPGDNITYVIAVYTSGRCAAGTSSKVAIQVIGDKTSSRVHVLTSSKMPTLRTNSDDWFIMYTKTKLGNLKQVVLWHDNKGRSPDWCCMRVVIYDLANRIQYIFPVEKWFQVTENAEKSQKTIVDVFIPDDVLRSRWVSFFGGHALSTMRDKHHWASIFIRHPRSLYTRSERATIAIGFLVTSMLSSMLFFNINSLGPSDYPMFHFSLDNFISSIKATVISTVLTLAIVFFFQRSKMKIKGVINELPDFTGKTKGPDTKKDKVKKFIKARFVEPVPFKPVVNDPKQLDQGRNIWLVFAWIVSVLTILSCSFFIILYGLKFGVKKSLVWMATFMLSVFTDLLVSNPLHLILGAFLVAYIFKTSSLEAFTLDVEHDTSNAPFRFYKERLDNAIRIRTRPEYKPMLLKNIEVLGWKRTVRRLRIELCFSSCILFLLCVSVSFIMYYFGITVIYFNNLQLKSLLSENSADLGIDVDKVYTKIEFYNYLQYSSLPLLHRIRWYNGRDLEVEGNEDNISNTSGVNALSRVKGFVIDYSSKLLGVPRLRQQRLDVEDSVPVPPMFSDWYKAAVYGSLYGEDKNDYLPGWKDYDPKVRIFKREDLWWYMNKYESLTGEYLGKSGAIYYGTGYPVNLYWALANSTSVVIDLSSDDWIDNRTRSIFLEVNVYNANSNLFTTIAVVAEALPNGLYSAKLSIETASILFSSSRYELSILILVIVVTLVLFINVLYALYYLSRKGLTNYIANWSGVNNLVLIVVGLCFISVFFTRFLYFVLFADILEAAPRNAYTSLYPAFNYDFFAHCVTGFFILSITSISITLIHGSIGYARFRKALDMAKIVLIALFIINILFSYLVSMFCFLFGTLYIERLGILFTFKEVPPVLIEKMYTDRRQQFIIMVGLAILIMFLFNKASQIWYYSVAAGILGREMFVLSQILAAEPPGKKRRSEVVLKKRLENQLTRWRNRRKNRKRGGGEFDADCRVDGKRENLNFQPERSFESLLTGGVRSRMCRISKHLNKL